MVAQTIILPNIRKLFIPDSGYYIAEVDLAGADAQVVAWEANDDDLKMAFRSGVKLHIKNARDVFPDKTRGMSDEALKATDRAGGLYHDCKQAVHASDYGASARTVAINCGWPVIEGEQFQHKWFGLHPGIRDWQQSTESQLRGTQCWSCRSTDIDEGKCKSCGTKVGRTVRNKFGYRRIYFDRIEGLLPQALAWVPQSTVAIASFRGGLQLRKKVPWAELLLQVHDSFVFQFPFEMRGQLSLVKEAIRVQIPYNDPLEIPWGLKVSDRSWGDCEQVEW